MGWEINSRENESVISLLDVEAMRFDGAKLSHPVFLSAGTD